MPQTLAAVCLYIDTDRLFIDFRVLPDVRRTDSVQEFYRRKGHMGQRMGRARQLQEVLFVVSIQPRRYKHVMAFRLLADRQLPACDYFRLADKYGPPPKI